MRRPLLILMVALASVPLWGVAPRAQQSGPTVGVYDLSSYASPITAVLDTMRLPWAKLTEQDLRDPARLRRFPVVAVVFGYVFSSNDERNLPAPIQDALTTYVREGGHLYSEFAAYPSNEAAGGSGWTEGTQGDLKVLTTAHPITRGFKQDEVIKYSLYGANPSKGAGTPLLGTTTGALSMLVNECGKGVCVYSGAILGAMDANALPARQLIANVFAFLAGVPAPSFTVDVGSVEQQVGGPAPESRYPLAADGFVRHWAVAGAFTAPEGQPAENAFAADFLQPSDSAANPVVGTDAATLIPWRELLATAGGNSQEPIANLLPLYPGDHRFAYAACILDNPVARRLRLKVGSDDGFRLWLNGRLLKEVRTQRACFSDQDTVEAELVAGRNVLLFKIENVVGGFEVCLRVTDLNDQPAASLNEVVLRDPAAMAKAKGQSPEQAAAFDPAAMVVDLKATAVAVFSEAGFPYSAMPPAVTPERIADACARAGLRAELVSAAQLSDPAYLTVQRYHTLVMSYGETFPVECLGALREFLAAGGRLVCPAGVPFSHPVVRKDGRWHDDGYSGGTTAAVCDKLLPFVRGYAADRPAACAVVLETELLPGLPIYWPLTGGTIGFIPKVKDPAGKPFSIDGNRPVVVGVSEDGEALSTPVWFLHADPRVLLLGFTGASHPWSPEAWPHSQEAIAACLKLVTRQPVLQIRDTRPYLCAYRDGETVRIETLVRCTSGPAPGATVALEIRERDTGKVAFTTSQPVDLAAGEEKTLLFEWQQPRLPAWSYEIIVTASAPGGPAVRDREMFAVWKDKVPKEAPRLSMKGDIAHVNGRPTRLDGVNLYLDDERNIALYWGQQTFADGQVRPKTCLSIRDTHLGWLAATGANAVRESYYACALGPKVWEDDRSPALRSADSFQLLVGGNGFIAHTGPDVIGPNYTPWTEWVAEQKATSDPRALQIGMNRWCGQFARRYRAFRNIAWELQNEPDGPDLPTEAERVKLFADNQWYLADKRRCFEEGFGGGVYGLQNTVSSHNSGWDRRVLRGILDWTAIHPYSPPFSYERTRFHWGFSSNFGRPVVAGEVGMCSPASLEQLQHYLLAEGGLGYSHFYLFGAPGINYETCMGRPDQTEKMDMKPFRRYRALQQIIGPDRFLPPTTVLPYSHAQRLRDPASFDRLAVLYIDLLRKGIHPQVIEEGELAGLGKHVRTVLWWAGAELSEPAQAQLQRQVQSHRVKCLWLPDPQSAIGNRQSAIPDWVSHENLVDVLVKPLPVGLESGSPDVLYLLPERRGGFSVIVVNHTGAREMTLRARRHRVQIQVPPGRAALVSFDRKGRLVLAEAYGDVVVDGQALIQAPAEMNYVVASDDGRPIAQSRHLLLHAEPQSAVRVANTSANALSKLGSITLVHPEGDPYDSAAGLIRESLVKQGVKVTTVPAGKASPALLRSGHVLLLGDGSANPLARRFAGRLTVQGEAPTRFVDLGKAQLKLRWSGAIKVARSPWSAKHHAILVQGVSPGATAIAARAFASLQLLDDYTVGPWMRQRVAQ